MHAGASGVGTAAVQLARLLGAVPVVTAGSPEKLKMAEKLGAAAGFNYKEENFAERVNDFTEGVWLERQMTQLFSVPIDLSSCSYLVLSAAKNI